MGTERSCRTDAKGVNLESMKEDMIQKIAEQIRAADAYEIDMKSGYKEKPVGGWIEREPNETATIVIKLNGGATKVKHHWNGNISIDEIEID